MRRNLNNIFRAVSSVLCLLCLFSIFICIPKIAADPSTAQSTLAVPTPRPTPTPTLAPLKRDFGNSLPITVGEKYEYEIRYSRFPIYATVGIITFEYLGPISGDQIGSKLGNLNIELKPDPSDRLLHFRAKAVSKGILIAIVGADVSDRFETLIDPQDFSARFSFQEIKEGKKHAMRSSLYDRVRQSIHSTFNDLTKPQLPPREKMFERKDGTVDLLSSFYFVRLQKLKEGQVLRFPVSDDDRIYEFEIVVGKHEKLSTDCGKVKAIRLEPKLFGPGKYFSRPGEMTMWVTNDNKHVPLRLVAKSPSGTLSAKLINFKKNCKIIEPDPESPNSESKEAKPPSNN